MRILSVIAKSMKEQLRNFWILLLTVSLAPFFVFVYYLITEASQPQYDLILVNEDSGTLVEGDQINKGDELLEAAKIFLNSSNIIPLKIKIIQEREEAIIDLKNKRGDALIIIPSNFSHRLNEVENEAVFNGIEIEFIGDITNINYIITAIWGNEILSQYVATVTNKINPVIVKEESLGVSGQLSDFELMVPGLLILSIIMLMLSASIAIIVEVENKTILRLKLSRLTAFEFLSGVGFVQIIVGIISIMITLWAAMALGFNFTASIYAVLFIAIITSISIIAFSLILAACTKSANEVLIVGNFPLFLFMFFTGAAFPISGEELFSFAGYPITLQGLMSPTHAINALNKLLVMDLAFIDILPEIIALLVITAFYFLVGVWAFNKRHMKVE